jgi:hypothetical protein
MREKVVYHMTWQFLISGMIWLLGEIKSTIFGAAFPLNSMYFQGIREYFG